MGACRPCRPEGLRKPWEALGGSNHQPTKLHGLFPGDRSDKASPELLQRGRRGQACGIEIRKRAESVSAMRPHHGLEQPLLTAEQAVDLPLGPAGLRNDVVDRNGIIAVPKKQAGSGIEQPLSPLVVSFSHRSLPSCRGRMPPPGNRHYQEPEASPMVMAVTTWRLAALKRDAVRARA